MGKDLSFVIYFGVVLQVFDLMRKQEQTRLAELDAEKVHFELIQSQGDIVSKYSYEDCFKISFCIWLIVENMQTYACKLKKYLWS